MGRLIKRALLFILIVGVSLLTIVLTIPDRTDYAEATIDKHSRLEQALSPRLIFVGGSSVAYGLDSRSIKRELRYSPVNMGMMAFLGIRFMLDEIRSEIRKGDVVVLCPDYNTYITPVDGDGEDLLAVVKVYPKAITYFGSLHQVASLAKTIASTASWKVMSRISRSLKFDHTNEQKDEFVRRTISRRGAFNEYGDMVGNVNADWPFEFNYARDLSRQTIDPKMIELIDEFYEYAKSQGSIAMVLFSPLAETCYKENRQFVDALYDRLRRELNCPVVGLPNDYVYPDEYFYDSVYHLNARGKMMRTAKVIQDLRTALAVYSASR